MNNEEYEKLKIGQLVKLFLPKIIEYIENVDKEELHRLSESNYSKLKFNINYPFVARINEISQDEDVRFWKKVYSIGGKNYRFCSQWYAFSRDLFFDYLIDKNIVTKEESKLYKPYEPSKEENLEKLVKKKTHEIEEIREKYKELNEQHQQLQFYFKVLQKTEKKNENKNVEKFESNLQEEARHMSIHYETFYCLERSIRKIIEMTMVEKFGDLWWVKKVDPQIQESVKNLMKWESDTVFSKRSSKEIDYTTFSQLRQIVKFNWHIFKEQFRSEKAFNRLMADLNQLRVPIAHCTPFNKKEKRRLDLTIDDWFDLIGQN